MLIVGSMVVMSAVFYLGTVEVQARAIDAKLTASIRNLAGGYESRGMDGLRLEIQQLLADGIDQDTEVYLLSGPDGRKLAGNLAAEPAAIPPDVPITLSVARYGRPSISRLVYHRLPNGGILVVGRDLQDQREIESLVWRSLGIGGSVALLLAVLGAVLFGRQLGGSIAAIRRTALEIQAGDLSRRIPLGHVEDEFTRLSRDINHMLDRIEQLMDGVRHVSNTIAHNLRTPLGRIRGQLDEALRD
ncbi:MAG TPA: HAMP domain-containing protein, partial [Gammaproteobacteria bacterium]|nr:HAMP domain-containing protein [Gammaproteobacteria bacterium]